MKRYLVIPNLVFFCLALLTVASTSCKKREARMNLQGDWTVTGFKGVWIDTCSGDDIYYDRHGEEWGAITFEDNQMKRDYQLVVDSAICYPKGQEEDQVRWRVVSHEEELIVAHRYILEIDGEEWSVLFGDEGVGELPLDQDLIYLNHTSNRGDDFALELTRTIE